MKYDLCLRVSSSRAVIPRSGNAYSVALEVGGGKAVSGNCTCTEQKDNSNLDRWRTMHVV